MSNSKSLPEGVRLDRIKPVKELNEHKEDKHKVEINTEKEYHT